MKREIIVLGTNDVDPKESNCSDTLRVSSYATADVIVLSHAGDVNVV